ncbi:MAG TPA: pilus assembly protein TadG-related protein [Candidatus Limnocylindrales bacterium]|nr:pilus assembly protein TadG-related protein [Candidatus Limnocylindrales bacterium]
MNHAIRQLRNRRRDASGQVLVLFALMLVVLLLASALAVDYGGWLVAKRNQQNVSDAAALAGAQQLTRPLTNNCPSGSSKAVCARQAAWQVIKSSLNLTLDPIALGQTSTGVTAVSNGGYKIWVSSPPGDAGSSYLGHTTGPGNVYVRIDHPGQTYLSSIVGVTRSVAAWSTAGRFPANFAVIGMCSPTDITANCLAGDSNIKLDGTNTNLIVNTGDIGTNRWTRSGGTNSGVALGKDSNAYMELYDDCWTATGNQCNVWGYTGVAVDTTDVRSAIPLGAAIQDPAYAAPTINSTTAPNQCRGTGTVQLASAHIVEQQMPDVQLAAAVQPLPNPQVVVAAGTNNDLTGTVRATALPSAGAVLSGITVTAVGPTATYTLTTNASGQYTQKKADSGVYSITASDASGVYHSTASSPVTSPSVPTSGNGTITAPDIFMQKNPTISGTIFSSLGGTIGGASVSITGSGGPYPSSPATANGSGGYGPISISGWGASNTWNVNASATFYTSNSANSGFLSLDTAYTVNVTLTPAPAQLTGTVTDAVTGLAIPNLTVTLSGTNSASTTTNAAGSYTFGSVAPGAGTTITLTGNLTGYMAGSPSSPTNPTTQSLVGGSNTVNFALWPKGCDSSGNAGNWSCDYPSNGNCPAPTNVNAANVNCTFTQANAIRPGTYNNITIPNGTCAWLDSRGGATGLASGQSGGIYHIKGQVSIGNGSYLFGDGVTLVFDRNTNIDVGNSGGFVLNYGTTHATINDATTSCSGYATAFTYENSKAGYYPCFRTVDNAICAASPSTTNCPDYAYAAWTTKGNLLWSGTQSPAYTNSTVTKGSELGITFYFYCPTGTQCGLGNSSRMKLATASMGYLFNGVLYGPGDDIQLGGGKDGQTAAGQIVGWTIEYHGGTQIQQNWYGDPVDGQPFLIEPTLGE